MLWPLHTLALALLSLPLPSLAAPRSLLVDLRSPLPVARVPLLPRAKAVPLAVLRLRTTLCWAHSLTRGS